MISVIKIGEHHPDSHSDGANGQKKGDPMVPFKIDLVI